MIIILLSVPFAANGIAQETQEEEKHYSIQLVPYLKNEDAEAMVRELRGRGYDPYIFETPEHIKPRWYAVRIGDYSDLDQARNVLEKFNEKEKIKAFITYIDSIAAISLAEEETRPGARKAEPPVSGETPEETETDTQTAEEVDAVPDSAEDTGVFPSEKPDEQYMGTLMEEMRKMKEEIRELREEAKAREVLGATEEERQEEEKEILESVGREYTLSRKGTISLDYSFGYSYNSSDEIEWMESPFFTVEHKNNHNLSNSIGVQYALLDNLNLSCDLPFVYAYDKTGTQSSRTVTDLGDISLGFSWQPFKTGIRFPSPILNINFSVPTGRSPYEAMEAKDLSTGSGHYSTTIGMSISKSIDPAVAFGSFSTSYTFPATNIDQIRSNGILEEVGEGMSMGLSMGLGYSLSYRVSLSLSYQMAYSFSRESFWRGLEEPKKSGTSISSSFSLSTGWRITRKFSINTGIGIGLTSSNSDFSFSLRIPYNF